MGPTLFVWLSTSSLLILILSSIAATILPDMLWHDLEEFCEKRNRPRLFSTIHEHHELAALAAQALQVLSLALFLISSQAWLFREESLLDPLTFTGDVVGVTAVLMVSMVWLPWAIAEHFGPAFIYYTWPVWSMVSTVLYPMTFGVDLLGGLLKRAAGIEDEPTDEEEDFEEEIRTIVTEAIREGHIEEDAREMIEGVMDLDDTETASIMTPRSEIDALAATTQWWETVEFISKTGRTRIPIWDGNRDNFAGLLYVKDLLPELARPESTRKSLLELSRPVIHVPQSMTVSELLKYFLRKRTHLALVVDEYHAVTGLVTIEDVLEEIVGEIVDEHDLDETDNGIVQISNEEADVTAKAHVEDINEVLGMELPEDDDYDTIGGLVIHEMKRIPKPGEKLQVGDVEIQVTASDRRRIHQLRLIRTRQNKPLPA
ncbi:hemolysin family protein [Bremerella cremea]|uniref:hemolysin family protein n=1 Tax=Bremerella cremea TaxID=1031537 RepID=UPI0031EB9C96